MRFKIIVTIFILFFSSILSIHGKEDKNNSGLPPVEKIGEFKFKFGGIIIDQKERSLEFNATSNQRNGLIEYVFGA